MNNTNQVISYNKLPDEHLFYNVNILTLSSDINKFNAKILRNPILGSEDQNRLSKILISSLKHLSDKEQTQMHDNLENELNQFLPQVLKMENIPSDLLEQAKSIDSLINTKTEILNINEKTLTQELRPLERTSHNLFNSLRKREYLGKLDNHSIIMLNIKANNYKEIEFDHGEQVLSFAMQDDLIATRSQNSIKLWEKTTGKCLWTYEIHGFESHSCDEVGFIKDHIYCKNAFQVQIIDLKTGKQKHSFSNQNSLIFPVGDKVFIGKTDVDGFDEWNFDGKCVNSIHLKKPRGWEAFPFSFSGPISKNLATEKYLITLDPSSILIYDRLNKCYRKVQLIGNFEIPTIAEVLIDDDRLFCGFAAAKDSNHPDCIEIDLTNGEIIKQYEITERVRHHGEAKPIANNNEWVILSHKIGIGNEINNKIVAIHLSEKKSTILGDHSNHYGACMGQIDGQILVTVSGCMRTQLPTSWLNVSAYNAKFMFWDLKTMSKIEEMDISFVRSMSFVNGKLYINDGNKVIAKDFLCS